MASGKGVAVVVGAGSGLSASLARLFAEQGMTVILAARNPDGLADLVKAGAGRVAAMALDVTKPDQVAAAAKNADVNLLINNAGVAGFAGLIAAKDTAQARLEMETNYFGVLNMVRAFAPVLATNGGGAIVNLASIVSHVSFPALGSYSASKAAVHSLTQGIRAELEAQGTQVTGVYPGPVDTDMAAEIDMDKVSPRHVAGVVLDGVAAGEQDVYPDPMSQEMHAGLLADPKAVERQAGEMRP